MSARASITILAQGEAESQALAGWARGLDWVHWLLENVRARLETLTAECEPPEREREVLAAWEVFAETRALPVLGPALCRSWEAAHEGRTRALAGEAEKLRRVLQGMAAESSAEAAHLLLRTTRGARFQGVLGKHRAAIVDGRCPAQFIPVWAAVGVLFQLGLANVCAEYLRLEWEMLSRRCAGLPEPGGAYGITALTRRILQANSRLDGECLRAHLEA